MSREQTSEEKDAPIGTPTCGDSSQASVSKGSASVEMPTRLLEAMSAELEQVKKELNMRNEELAIANRECETVQSALDQLQCDSGTQEAPPEDACTSQVMGLEDLDWLVKEMSMATSASQHNASQEIAAVISTARVWSPIWALRPQAASLSCSRPVQHFGLIFGSRPESGPLELRSTLACPEAFAWKPSETFTPCPGMRDFNATLSELTDDLDHQLQQYLDSVFLPWARQQEELDGEPLVAWVVCNDGEAFALQKPLVEFGRSAEDRWRATVVVADRAKSSADNMAVEVMALGGPCPERLLFDIKDSS